MKTNTIYRNMTSEIKEIKRLFRDLPSKSRSNPYWWFANASAKEPKCSIILHGRNIYKTRNRFRGKKKSYSWKDWNGSCYLWSRYPLYNQSQVNRAHNLRNCCQMSTTATIKLDRGRVYVMSQALRSWWILFMVYLVQMAFCISLLQNRWTSDRLY